MSLETKAKSIHPLTFSVTLYGCQTSVVKKMDSENKQTKRFVCTLVLEESSMDPLHNQEEEQAGPRTKEA